MITVFIILTMNYKFHAKSADMCERDEVHQV